mmetsp:Transcript_111701/g.316712  ORF Transcript_111701/g.316712 Transcript_111701/m.316712 type:complete len:212 (-) Transcript_111701:112-747(-)
MAAAHARGRSRRASCGGHARPLRQAGRLRPGCGVRWARGAMATPTGLMPGQARSSWAGRRAVARPEPSTRRPRPRGAWLERPPRMTWPSPGSLCSRRCTEEGSLLGMPPTQRNNLRPRAPAHRLACLLRAPPRAPLPPRHQTACASTRAASALRPPGPARGSRCVRLRTPPPGGTTSGPAAAAWRTAAKATWATSQTTPQTVHGCRAAPHL